MIEITELTKAFDTNIIFSKVSFNINDGDFVVFSGKSGCGKTTMLNMIGALEKPTSGKIIVDGVNIASGKKRTDYLSHKVGFLFQNFALVENKTVEQNLKMVAKRNRTEISIDSALNEVQLLSKKDALVYTLSGGEQQRVALARLMIKKCDIILADEPTGSLDRTNAGIIVDILKKLNEKGKTVIMVTHDESLKNVGNRLINL